MIRSTMFSGLSYEKPASMENCFESIGRSGEKTVYITPPESDEYFQRSKELTSVIENATSADYESVVPSSSVRLGQLAVRQHKLADNYRAEHH